MRFMFLFLICFGMIGCAGSSDVPEETASDAGNVTETAVKSCSGHLDIWIDDEISSEFYPDIHWALTEWEKYMSPQLSLDHFAAADRKYMDLKAVDCVVKVEWGQDTDTSAWAHGYGRNLGLIDKGIIMINKLQLDSFRKNHDIMRAAMLHEFGHVLGLSHYTGREHPSIMEPYLSFPAKIGCQDVKDACAIWGCSVECDTQQWID